MRKLLLLTMTIVIGTSLFAQNAQNTPNLNRAFLRYFSGIELSQLEQEQPTFYNVLNYYMTESFTVENLDCPNCIVDYNEFYNHDLFNVYEHETRRKTSMDSIFVYKLKYVVKLKSTIEMNSHLANYSPDEIVNFVSPRPLPTWISTGDNQIDYNNYMKSVNQWAKDFPEDFRELTNSTTLRKIRFQEFISFPENKRNTFLNAGTQYLIID
jgi:hypothetical protein